MSELSNLIDEAIRYYVRIRSSVHADSDIDGMSISEFIARALRDKYIIEERTEYLEEMRQLAEEAKELTKNL